MNVWYSYLRNQFTQPGNGLMQLILIHILSFLFVFAFSTTCYICGYEDYIPLVYEKFSFPSLYSLLLEKPWALLTYAFVHKSLLALFWDMGMLYTFGQSIRAVAHAKHIWRLYCLGQAVGALAFGMLYQFSPPFRGITDHLMGPSAAIYAIMAAVCVLVPGLKVNFFFIFVPFRYMAFFLLLFAFIHLPSNQAGYYLAQLSGALAGYIYAKRCKKNGMDRNGSFFRINSVNSAKMSVSVTKK